MMAEMEKRPYTIDESTSVIANSYNSTLTSLKSQEIELKIEPKEKASVEKIYNPYEHRILKHPNGFTGAFLHMVKTSLGTGILAIPRAFKNAGLIVGFIGTVLVGIICTHAIHILVKSSRKVCRKTKTPSLGFADTAEGVVKLGPQSVRKYAVFAKFFVEAGLCLSHILANSVYLVFISISFTKFFSSYYPEIETWGDYSLKLIILLPLLLCAQVRELKHLVPFSFIANIMLLVTFSITGYYMISGIGEVDIKERHLANSISGIPSFFSTVLFSIEGIGSIMPVENSMLTPTFIGCSSVLNLSMMVILTLYTSIGFLGYYRFGEDTAATITANLPSDDLPADVAQLTLATGVFFSFMLLFYVPVDIIWSKIKSKIPEERWSMSQIILRTILILFVTVIAIAGGENLGSLIDLVGAIFLSTLGLFVPAILEIIIDWEDGWGVFHWRLIKNIIIMILAVFGLCSGVFYAVQDLVK